MFVLKTFELLLHAGLMISFSIYFLCSKNKAYLIGAFLAFILLILNVLQIIN